MLKELNAIANKIEKLVIRANELAGSENEQTAEKYDAICDMLETVQTAIDEAIEELEAAKA